MFIRLTFFQENSIENTEEKLHKLNVLVQHLEFQEQNIEKSAHSLEYVKEQVRLFSILLFNKNFLNNKRSRKLFFNL